MKHCTPTALVILDGFGYSPQTEYNAIEQAHTPFFDQLLSEYPYCLLKASGLAVGLPEGTAGNSEVGHLTIGSGSVVMQPYTIIEHAIKDGDFFNNSILKEKLKLLKESGKRLHLMGLLSDGSVHGSLKHALAFLEAAQKAGITQVMIHAFLDGRDVTPQSAHDYLEQLEVGIKKIGIGELTSIHGRFYAMDRNKQWQLTEKSYHTLTEPHTTKQTNWQTILEKNYAKKITDEFIPPTQLMPDGYIKDSDGIIFWNFRPDRARQLTSLFLNQKKHTPKLSFFITPVSYGPEYPTTALFKKPAIQNSLTKMLHDKGFSIFSIAETEKYAHVTYFFNGGREEKLTHETRILVPSLGKKEYVDHPEMSADTITEAVLASLKQTPADFYVINYANADMVGHTGNFASTVKAIECLDKQLQKLFTTFVQEHGGTLYITADHGNAEAMFDPETGQPNTSHTVNPVFFIMANKILKNSNSDLPLSELSDIAPFIVHNFENPLS